MCIWLSWSRSTAFGYTRFYFDSVLRNWHGGHAVPAGDSLLFVAGALSALPTNDLNVHLMVLLMVIAAIVGDALNYTIGRLFGEKLFSNPNSKIFRRSYRIRPIASTNATAVRPSSWPVSCRSSERLRRLWREWGICPIVILRCITLLARCCGYCYLPTRVICSAICRSSRKP